MLSGIGSGGSSSVNEFKHMKAVATLASSSGTTKSTASQGAVHTFEGSGKMNGNPVKPLLNTTA